jgi:TRAP-type transport system periplasmic protein
MTSHAAARVLVFLLAGAGGVALTSGVARGDGQVTLRLSTIAPEGSSWARELHAFGTQVDARTQSRVKVRWFMNGVAGDEQETESRMRRGQLDGVASGGMVCQHFMPTMRVLRLPGLFQDRDEAKAIVNRLLATMSAEASENGMVNLGTAALGVDVLFGRKPIHSLAELRATRAWRWDIDDVALTMAREMGMPIVPLPPAAGARAYEDGKLDGFWAVPAAAIAFQWSVQAPYVVRMSGSFLYGCVMVKSTSFHQLSAEDQKAVSTAAAELRDRFDELDRQEEEALFNGIFQHQGVQMVPVTEKFRAEFFAAANAARRKAASLVPPGLIDRVQGFLADYRAEHGRANR